MPSHPAPENKGGCVFNAFPKKKINNKGSVRKGWAWSRMGYSAGSPSCGLWVSPPPEDTLEK